jgi:exodeoxyribonuclease VII large subunit
MFDDPRQLPERTFSAPQRKIYSISQLTARIKALLEDAFPLVWVTGEVSNFSVPVSGHFYFTLKDAHAQIRAVMFRGQNRNLKFTLEDGMRITGLGRISLYEPRGTYQIIFEYLEPQGVGALQVAFDQLKKRLDTEGLFDPARKRPLPFLPRKISLVTSSTGAAVHDMLSILSRRYPDLAVEIVPVRVQGDGAEHEMVAALALLNRRADAEVIIIGRGGGSLEDLWAFNTEVLARAIAASAIPVVSAVGHETDFTIADFVADLRAPTPSAAAELVVPLKADLKQRHAELSTALVNRFAQRVSSHRGFLTDLTRRLVHPAKRLQDLRLRIDDLTNRMIGSFHRDLTLRRERLEWRQARLQANSPLVQVQTLKDKLTQCTGNLAVFYHMYISRKRHILQQQSSRLFAMSPLAVLARGYSIARSLPERRLLRDFASVVPGSRIEVLLEKGSLTCRVEETSADGHTNL